MTAHNDEAEQIVLGAMMTAPSVVDATAQRLSGADFYDPKHATVFAAIVRNHAAGRPTEPVAVAEALTSGDLKRVGAPYLHDLVVAGAPLVAQAAYYVRVVAECGFIRRACEAATRVQQVAEAGDGDRVAAELAKLSDLAASHNGARVGPGVRLTSAATIKPRPVRWVWEDRVPAGAVTLMPGREGIGKSLTLVWLTAQITRGMLPGIHLGVARPVIYAATEDSWERTIVPRLIAAGADLDLVYRVDVLTETNRVDALSLPRDCAALAVQINRLGVAMLALDPLMSTIGEGIDTHRDRELRTALEPMSGLADSTSCAIVGLAHFNKSNGTDPLSLVTGSRAFTAVIRAAIGAARDPDADDGSCVLSQIKNNLGRLDVPSLRYVVEPATVDTDEGPANVGLLRILGESERSVSDILRDGAGDDDQRAERDEAAEWLRGWLADQGGEASPNDAKKAAGAAGIAVRTLERARRRAGVTTQRVGFGPGASYIWRIDLSCSPHARHARQLPGVGIHGGHVADMAAGTDGEMNEQSKEVDT